MSVIAHNLGAIGAGLGTTLVIALLAYAGALLAGTLIAVCRVSPIPPLRAVSTVWVTLACNIPTLCLMLLLAFVAPRAGVPISLFSAAVGAILFAGSGYVCEAVRSGINSVAKGQIEAARALGMPFGLIVREIVLPQALQARAESIARDLTASVVQGCGQFCTNPGLVIGIASPAFTAFTQQVAQLIGEQPAQTMLNAGTLGSYGKGLEKLRSHPGIQHLAGSAQSGNQAQPQLFKADVRLLIDGDEVLQEEVFGPTTVFVEVADQAQLSAALQGLHGQLTATLIGEPTDLHQFAELTPLLEQKVGRILLNGYPTGVEVCDSMVHGGPYPATSDARGTSVGTLAIDRFLRPVCFQNYPDSLLPDALKNANPLRIQRLVNGTPSRESL